MGGAGGAHPAPLDAATICVPPDRQIRASPAELDAPAARAPPEVDGLLGPLDGQAILTLKRHLPWVQRAYRALKGSWAPAMFVTT